MDLIGKIKLSQVRAGEQAVMDNIKNLGLDHLFNGDEAPKEEQIGEVEKAMNIIKQAMVDDNPSEPGSYAHSWHCNIAMMCHDAIHAAGIVEAGLLSPDAPHKIGNDAASRFMKLCFDVETKQ